jgi:hypothetical protein
MDTRAHGHTGRQQMADSRQETAERVLLDRHAGFEHRRGGAAVTTHPAFVAAADTVIAGPFLVTVFPAYLLVTVSKSIGESCYTPSVTG